MSGIDRGTVYIGIGLPEDFSPLFVDQKEWLLTGSFLRPGSGQPIAVGEIAGLAVIRIVYQDHRNFAAGHFCYNVAIPIGCIAFVIALLQEKIHYFGQFSFMVLFVKTQAFVGLGKTVASLEISMVDGTAEKQQDNRKDCKELSDMQGMNVRGHLLQMDQKQRHCPGEREGEVQRVIIVFRTLGDQKDEQDNCCVGPKEERQQSRTSFPMGLVLQKLFYREDNKVAACKNTAQTQDAGYGQQRDVFAAISELVEVAIQNTRNGVKACKAENVVFRLDCNVKAQLAAYEALGH